MHRNILIAGLVAVLSAGAALAQNPPPAPRAAPGVVPPGPGPRDQAGQGFRRDGRGGADMRRFMRPTPEEVQRRVGEAFTRMDANRDGRVTFEEFRQEQERQRMERQRQMFQRFSGGQDSVTLDQLKARALEQLNDRGHGRGRGRGPGRPPGGQPPAPPAPLAR
ncbi:MAG TPA: hypothetical protein VL460_06730 [Caulobacteraceae bacterium]|nr:hypothetical protein [Caulobacteraceae bacterium]